MKPEALILWAEDWKQKIHTSYVNGKWLKEGTGNQTSLKSPLTLEVTHEIEEASHEDVDRAVEGAQKALHAAEWKSLSTRERASRLRKIGDIVRKHQDQLAALEVVCNGKTYKEAFHDDLPDASDVFDYYAGWTDKLYGQTAPVEEGFLNVVYPEPLGVCALIVPWNYPLLLATWKIAPALAMGNTCVVKPSPFTSLSLLYLVEKIHESEILPSSVLQVVLGGERVGKQLSEHQAIDKISFTGSTGVGAKIVESSARSNLKRVTLELGGKSPNIIFADTPDKKSVFERSFHLMFSHKGEKCTEPTRFFIQKEIYQEAIDYFVAQAEQVQLGDPFESSTTQGPQCHEAHFHNILTYFDMARDEGLKLVSGGGSARPPGFENGLFVKPTIYQDVPMTSRLAQQEIFGPVLCVTPFETEEQVIQMANQSDYGLAAGVYSGDAKRALRVGKSLEAGMVFVNHYGCYHFSSPFGGHKQSGWGHEMGEESLRAYTKIKSLWMKYS